MPHLYAFEGEKWGRSFKHRDRQWPFCNFVVTGHYFSGQWVLDQRKLCTDYGGWELRMTGVKACKVLFYARLIAGDEADGGFEDLSVLQIIWSGTHFVL
ncbi:hypothetical protein D3C81_1696370 [compost metagenome]